MLHRGFFLVLLVLSLLWSCTPAPAPAGPPTVVVTYSALGALVRDLVGDRFRVVVPLPNGLDVHEWEPSAQDLAAMNRAALIVRNGLSLEGGMEKALEAARVAGVPLFTASDHVAVRTVKPGQGLPGGDADQAAGAQDPHLWLDPLRMKAVVLALAAELKTRFGADLGDRAAQVASRLDALDAEIRGLVAPIPAAKRLLVTGHESMGYFAEAYGFTLVGALVPSLSTQAEVSAGDMASLKRTLIRHPVAVIFTETGTPPKVAAALGQELGVKVVPIVTHALGPDGSYFTLLRTLATEVTQALGP
jgi:zinc/manganese transport system substrate-binding protein